MKKFFAFLALFFLIIAPAYGEIFEASGRGKIPAYSENPAQGKILARRGAIVDLQRNLLIKTKAQPYNKSSSSASIIRGIIITSETWDGKIYTVTGYINR